MKPLVYIIGALIVFLGLMRGSARRLSSRGRELLIKLEGIKRNDGITVFELKEHERYISYVVDGKPHAAIGTLIDEESEQWLIDAELTASQVRKIFHGELVQYERLVNTELGGSIVTQAQFDALVIFAFNLGSSQFKSSTLLAKVKAGERRPEVISQWFGAWNNSGALDYRRGMEADLFNNSYYS